MKHLIKKEVLFNIVESFKSQRILVLGDVMLDRYQYGEVERISPEAPVPVVRIVKEEYRLGGAANVANNIKSLGGEVFLVGSCGKDRFGSILKQMLAERGIDFRLFKKNTTTLKTRIIAQGQHLLRIDKEDVRNENIDFNKLNPLLKEFDTVIVSDYAKGFVTDSLLKEISNSCKNKKVLIDPKVKNFSYYKGSFLTTPNKKEASLWWGKEIEDNKDLLAAGSYIMRVSKSKNLIITLGKEGMVVFTEKGEVWKIEALVHNVFDVTGAGDVVISILGLALKSGANLLDAAFLANLGAGISVGKLGTSTVSAEELTEALNKGLVLFEARPLTQN